MRGVERWRTHRPVRSQVVETVITTVLVALVVVAFSTLLATVLTNP
ncbi:hypothetical protein ACGFSB_22040 [Streptomyces sp. NPDC048441]